MSEHVQVEGEDFEVSLQDNCALINGKRFSFGTKDDFILWNGKSYRVEVLSSHVLIDGRPYRYRFVAASQNKKNAGMVYSTMSGRVSKILVAVDQTLKKGDLLCTIEAMKMENHILGQIDGKVSVIHIALGDTVRENQLLFEISLQ